MDPLSVTASVVGLTATCVQTAKALGDLKSKYQNAHLTIGAICTETTIISASLSRIQSSMLGSPEGLKNKLSARPDLEATLDQALTGCYVVFDVLQTEVEKLSESSEPESSRIGFRSKLRFVWNEQKMQDILAQIRGLQTALTLLLQLLGTCVHNFKRQQFPCLQDSSDTMAELKQIMDNNTMVLSQVVQHTTNFRSKRANHAPQSIFEMTFDTRSIHNADSGSVITSTRFLFDDQVVNSRAYRRALAKAYSNVRGGNDAKDVRRVSGTDIVELKISGNKNEAPSPGITEVGRLIVATGAESNSDTRRVEKAMHSLATLDTPVLKLPRSDRRIGFMLEERPEVKGWFGTWYLEAADLENVPKNECGRQQLLHEIINFEYVYLDQLQALQYHLKSRLILDSSMPKYPEVVDGSPLSLRDSPWFKDMYDANKTLLYDPLKSRQASEGPWISTPWDIFQNWLKQSSQLYVDYAYFYPLVLYAMSKEAKEAKDAKEAKENPKFFQFPDKDLVLSTRRQMEWSVRLRFPLTRVHHYTRHLQRVLFRSDRSNPRHEYAKLEQLLRGLLDLRTRCEVAVLRSRLGDAGQSLFPKDPEIQFSQVMLYNDRRKKSVVVVLVLQKPEEIILVLRETKEIGITGDYGLEVVAKLDAFPVVVASVFQEKERRYIVTLTYLQTNNDGLPASISLMTPEQKVAREFQDAVVAIANERKNQGSRETGNA